MMTLRLDQDRASFGIEVPLDTFEHLARAHLHRFPTTRAIEEQARRFIEDGFPQADVRRFVEAVCGWGNYAGIAGRVLKRNSLEAIGDALHHSLEHLDARPVDLAAALRCTNVLNGLGSPSFASKHLRFLRPEVAPVFDSLLQQALPYSSDPKGYVDFGRDCTRLADALTARGVPNAFHREDERWFVADVEASLYAYVYPAR
jgi:hypothetical protein